MSDNPFCNYNETNNRFKFLESEKKSLKKDKPIFVNYISTNNIFKRQDERRDTIVKETKLEITPDFFPVLGKQESSNISQVLQTGLNFKDILNNQFQEEIVGNTNNIITPGWVEIYKCKQSNNIIWNNGCVETEEIEENINDSMNNIIELMKQRWEKYKEEYDEANGDGSYDKIYTLPPIYGDEYDMEDDIEDDIGDDIEDEEDIKEEWYANSFD